jgi:hypothetical protein
MSDNLGSSPIFFEEVDWQHGSEQINDCKYLYMRAVEEIEELTLKVELHEAKLGDPMDMTRELRPWENLLTESRPIEVNQTCRAFQLIFERDYMISYTVLNESYGKYSEQPEMFTGKLLRVFSWSHLLEFTRRTTYAGNELTGPLQHYEAACLNQILDVICTRRPRIFVQKLPAVLLRTN